MCQWDPRCQVDYLPDASLRDEWGTGGRVRLGSGQPRTWGVTAGGGPSVTTSRRKRVGLQAEQQANAPAEHGSPSHGAIAAPQCSTSVLLSTWLNAWGPGAGRYTVVLQECHRVTCPCKAWDACRRPQTGGSHVTCSHLRPCSTSSAPSPGAAATGAAAGATCVEAAAAVLLWLRALALATFLACVYATTPARQMA